NWCRGFDSRVLDGEKVVDQRPVYIGIVNWLGRLGAWVSYVSGLADKYIVDGLANLMADVVYGVGGRLRNLQKGYLRSYVLFLVLAAVGVFLMLSYLVRIALAG